VGSVEPEGLARLPSPRIFKTHLLRQWLPREGRFVVVVRDPTDVAVSYYELYRAYLGFGGSLDEFLERFVAGRVQYGSWWAHVRGWERHAGPSVMLVRYEALRADPAGELRRVAAFAGLPCDAERIARAVEGASLARMKAIEERFDHATSLLLERGVHPRSFIGRGEGACGALTVEQRARIEAAGQRPRERERAWLPAFLH
jgi:hypothetical protein